MKSFVLFAFAAAASAAFAAPCLIGESARPADSVFEPADKVQIFFRVTGLEPKQSGLSLKVDVVDDYGKSMRTYDQKLLADVGGMDEARFQYNLPCGNCAFYRVKAELSDGTKLKTAWSDLPDGEMTYCILTNGAAGLLPLPDAAALAPFREVLDSVTGGKADESPLYDLSKGRPKASAVKRTAPKEAYPMLQALAAFLKDRTLVGEVKAFGDNVRAYSFSEKGTGRTALALWMPGADKPKTVNVQTCSTKTTEVMSRFGAVCSMPVDGRKIVRVDVGSRPVFVLDADPAALAK